MNLRKDGVTMKQAWKRTFIIILASIIIIFSCFQATLDAFVMPFWNNVNLQKTGITRLTEKYLYSNIDFLAPEESLWTVVGNISSKQSLKAEKNYLRGHNLIFFVIAIAIALFQCIIYSTTRSVFKEHSSSVCQIIAYIHQMDGKKG